MCVELYTYMENAVVCMSDVVMAPCCCITHSLPKVITYHHNTTIKPSAMHVESSQRCRDEEQTHVKRLYMPVCLLLVLVCACSGCSIANDVILLL